MDRCPYCSFHPISLSDYCDAHRPDTKMKIRTHEWMQDFVDRVGRHLKAGRTRAASQLFRQIPPDVND